MSNIPDDIQKLLAGTRSTDREVQGAAFKELLNKVEQPVTWSYDVWDEFVDGLSSKDNRLRSISAQLLSLFGGHSDPDGRIFTDIDKLVAVTRDEKFVTARHALLSLWQIGLGGAEKRKLVIQTLQDRFYDSAPEKNHTLIRYDIISSLVKLYSATKEPEIVEAAERLIESEPNDKYKKKYQSASRDTAT